MVEKHMNRKDTILLITSVIVSLSILEIGLRIFTPFPISWVSNKIKHEQLGYVMDPKLAGIDKSGFRNEGQETADIIAIGDSFTFGTNVDSDHSWPKVLGQMLNKNVYNYGVGGYGILQYSYILDRAVEKNPEAIVVGLFLANDLYDICHFVVERKYSKEQASQAGVNSSLCPSTNRQVSAELEKEAVNGWLSTKIALYSILTHYYLRYARGMEIDSMLRNDIAIVNDDTERAILHHLSTKKNAAFMLEKKVDKESRSDTVIVNDDMQRTIIHHVSIKRHATFMDLEKPDIAMAFGVLKDFLRKARRETQARKIRLGVVLIPSKPRVFYSYLKEKGYKLSDEYEQLVVNEDRLRRSTIAFMTKIGVPSDDALPGTEEALRKYKNMYPASVDGHPLDMGYRIIAEAAAELVTGQERQGQK